MLEKINEIKEDIKKDLIELRRLVEDDKTHEHIIASILEIKEEGIPYNKVLEQIVQDIFPMNPDLYETIYGLCKFISGKGYTITSYCNERMDDENFDKQQWLNEITGEIYHYIDTYS